MPVGDSRWKFERTLFRVEGGLEVYRDRVYRLDRVVTFTDVQSSALSGRGVVTQEERVKPDLNPLADRDRAPLLEAARQGNAKLIDLLLKNGADPNFADRGGINALDIVAERGDLRSTQLLLSAGARVDSRDFFERTALMLACRPPAKRDVVTLLLSSGANPDLRDRSGNTAASLVDPPGKTLTPEDRAILQMLEEASVKRAHRL